MPPAGPHHDPPPTDLGPRTGRFRIDGRRAALTYQDYESRWLLDLRGRASRADALSLLRACADVAAERGVRLVADAPPLVELLEHPEFDAVREAAPPPRTDRLLEIDVPPALAAYGRRLAAWLKEAAADEATLDEGRLPTSPIGEAVPEPDGTAATLTWYPDGRPARFGWQSVTFWTLDADAPSLEALGGKHLRRITVRETVVSPQHETIREDVARMLDGWVGAGTLLIEGDPEGKTRTLAVQALADHLVEPMQAAYLCHDPDARKAAAADLAARLVEAPGVDELYASDLELYWLLREGLWGD
jgi:hypothetical protein